MHLTNDQKQFYQDNGYIILSGILTPKEIEELSTEYNTTFENSSKYNTEALWDGNWKDQVIKKNDDAPVTIQSIHNLQFHSAAFSKLLHNDKLLDACEDVMGTENILLHHTKAHIKPPGKGAPFPMHQDYHYFPFKNHSMVAVFLNLDDSSPENGGLAVYPGSHKDGPQNDLSDVQTHHYVDQNKFPLDKATPVVAKKGDLVIFSYFLVHGSYINRSEKTRRMFLIQLFGAEDVPTKDVHKSPGQGWVLRGRNVNRSSDITKRYQL